MWQTPSLPVSLSSATFNGVHDVQRPEPIYYTPRRKQASVIPNFSLLVYKFYLAARRNADALQQVLSLPHKKDKVLGRYAWGIGNPVHVRLI